METKIDGMLTDEQKRAMVEQMREHLRTYTHADFARKIGISPQNAFAWLQRGAFNAELVAFRCPEISGDWLLTGKGPMLKRDRDTQAPAAGDGDIRRLLNAIAEEQRLTAKAQAQADKLLELMTVLAASIKAASGSEIAKNLQENL